jgi:hypothetical protein
MSQRLRGTTPLRRPRSRRSVERGTRSCPPPVNASVHSYSSRSIFRNVGNSLIHNNATATVPTPPSTAAGIAPNKAAVMPLSNSPSW